MAPVSHVDCKLSTVEALEIEKQASAQYRPASRHDLVSTVALLLKEELPFAIIAPDPSTMGWTPSIHERGYRCIAKIKAMETETPLRTPRR